MTTIVEHFLPPASGLFPGSLCVLHDAAGQVRPAVVADCAPGGLLLQLASRPDWGPTEALTISWSLSGRLRGLEGRVLETRPDTYELALAVGRDAAQASERRGSTRFALHAEALLLVDGEDVAGRAFDVSVLGAGLVLATPGPPVGVRGELLLHDAGQPLLPGVAVRVAFAHSDAPGLMRVGVEFDDANRSADATLPLLSAIEAYARRN